MGNRTVYLWGPHGLVTTEFEYHNKLLRTRNARDMALLATLEGQCAVVVAGKTNHIFHEVVMLDDPVVQDDSYTVPIAYASHEIIEETSEYADSN